jgi:hypothetical protein
VTHAGSRGPRQNLGHACYLAEAQARRPGGRLATSDKEPTPNYAPPPRNATGISPNTRYAATQGTSVSVEPQIGSGSTFAPGFVQGLDLNLSTLTESSGPVNGPWPSKVQRSPQPALAPQTLLVRGGFLNWTESNGPLSPTNTFDPTMAH